MKTEAKLILVREDAAGGRDLWVEFPPALRSNCSFALRVAKLGLCDIEKLDSTKVIEVKKSGGIIYRLEELAKDLKIGFAHIIHYNWVDNSPPPWADMFRDVYKTPLEYDEILLSPRMYGGPVFYVCTWKREWPEWGTLIGVSVLPNVGVDRFFYGWEHAQEYVVWELTHLLWQKAAPR